jgi:hypothetical protein
LKTVEPLRVPGVRIPSPPPDSHRTDQSSIILPFHPFLPLMAVGPLKTQ